MTQTQLNGLKIFFGVIFAAITYLIFKTSFENDMFESAPRMWHNEPWFRATIYDFYFNIAILSCWTWYKEKSKLTAVLWITGYVLLGSAATSFYVLRQLFLLKPGDSLTKVLLKNSV